LGLAVVFKISIGSRTYRVQRPESHPKSSPCNESN
jgi:hypothetical protein